MPKDGPKLSQFTLRALSPEQQLKMLLPPEAWPTYVLIFKQRQVVEHLQAIEVLLDRARAARPRDRAAIEREIAARREAVRVIEVELARADPNRRRQDEPAAPTSPAPAASPAAALESEQYGPQAELVRLFFQEVYSGRPSKKISNRALHERMKKWIAENDHDDRIAASEATIRRLRKSI